MVLWKALLGITVAGAIALPLVQPAPDTLTVARNGTVLASFPVPHDTVTVVDSVALGATRDTLTAYRDTVNRWRPVTPPPPPPPVPPPPPPVPPPPPPPPSGGWNEPAGLTLIGDRAWNSRASTITDRVGAEGWDPVEGRVSTQNFVIANDAADPLSPPSVLETVYTTQTGVAPGTAQLPWPTSRRTKRLYVRFSVKLDPAWFGNSSTTNKLFHVWIAGGNRVLYRAVCAGTAPCTFQVGLQGVTVSGETRTRLTANRGPGAMLRGQWYTYEVEHIANTPGQRDGVIRVWTNRVLTHEYTDVGMLGPAETGGWHQVQWSPTYGGGGAPPPHRQSIWLGHTYVSGTP